MEMGPVKVFVPANVRVPVVVLVGPALPLILATLHSVPLCKFWRLCVGSAACLQFKQKYPTWESKSAVDVAPRRSVV
jgi:hypothetical protein